MLIRTLAAAMLALSALAIVDTPHRAEAQGTGRTHFIERVHHKRLTGDTLARFDNMTYEECEVRCLADASCVALEHVRGETGIFKRAPVCRLFRATRSTHEARSTDIGWKRALPAAGREPQVSTAPPVPSREAGKAHRPDEKIEPPRSAPSLESKKSALKKAPPPSGDRAAPEVSATPPPGAPREVAESARPPAPETAPRARSYESSPTARSAPIAPPAPPAQPLPPKVPPVARAPASPPAAPPAAAPPPTPPASPPVASAPPPVPSTEPAAGPAPTPSPRIATAPPTDGMPSSAPRTRSLKPAAPPPAAASKAEAPPAPVASSPVTSPPPASSADPAASPDWDTVPVYYGTDRARKDQPKRIAYTSDRARRMELGRAIVTIPKVHQVPSIERPWAIKVPYLDITLYEEAEDPKRHFTVKEIKALTKEELLATVRERLKQSATYKGQALVFIHGYNNGFDDALYRTAQLAYDIKFDGAPFLYSWPSGGGTLSYPYDRDSAQQAEQYLSQFLKFVVNETGAESVSIIAHSMGNQPLLQVLRDLKRTSPDAARISQIILAAPDVDRDTFSYLSGQIAGISRGITMYASANDRALVVSRRFAGGIPRAGDVPEDLGPAVTPGVDTIDVSALSTEYLALNHSSYAEKTALLQDIELLLKTGERPPERRFPILQKLKNDTGDFWRYPK